MYWHYVQTWITRFSQWSFPPSINSWPRFRKHITISVRQILYSFEQNPPFCPRIKIYMKNRWNISFCQDHSGAWRRGWGLRPWARRAGGPWASTTTPLWLTLGRGGAACSPASATTAGKLSQTASTSSSTLSMCTFNLKESTATFVTKWSRTSGIWGSIWSLLTARLWSVQRMRRTPIWQVKTKLI